MDGEKPERWRLSCVASSVSRKILRTWALWPKRVICFSGMKTDEANDGKAKAVASSWQFPRRGFGGQQMPQHWELALCRDCPRN